MSRAENPLTLINVATWPDLMARLSEHFKSGTGFSLATLNLDHVVKLRDDATFQDVYRQQTLVVADGKPIIWLRRLMGQPVELIPGSELVYPVSELAAKLDVPVALLGATQETLDLAAKRLAERYPGFQVVAQIAPPMGFDPQGEAAEDALREIANKGARLCFLALGAPKQETLAARGHDLAPACGFVSIGAGLDFIAGTQTRAPKWVQAIAMEWFWRMAKDPRRLARRYGRCLIALPGLAWAARRDPRTAMPPPHGE